MRRTDIKYAAAITISAAALLAGCGMGDQGNQGAAPAAAPSATPGGMGAGAGDQAQQGQGQAGDVAAAKTQLQGKLDELQKSSPITFQPDSADLTDQGRQSLTQIADLVKQAPQELKFSVEGYTAPVSGSSTDAQQLSQQRAQNVANELTQQAGVAADRLQATAKGDATGDPESSRKVEVKLQ